MIKPEAVIFDMDGVLIDSEPIHYEVEERIFGQIGIDVPEPVHRSYVGTSSQFMYSDLKSRFGLKQQVTELMEMDDLFRSAFIKSLDDIHLNEGVSSLLNELKSAGLKLAVATSSSPEIVNVLLKNCGIASIFDAIVTTEEAGKSKPAPDVYWLAARIVGVSPAGCIVFEDSPNGISAAKNAGMYCIAVQSDYIALEELSKADFVIKTFRGMTLGKLIEIFSNNQILD